MDDARRRLAVALGALAVVVAVGAGVATLARTDGDAGTDGAPAATIPAGAGVPVTPLLPTGPLHGFRLVEAVRWPGPVVDGTEVRGRVYLGPGTSAPSRRPSLLLLSVANPDIRDLADGLSAGLIVRGHAAEDATRGSDLPVDAGWLWVERPGLALTLAVRGADRAVLGPVADGLVVSPPPEDGGGLPPAAPAAVDPATLPDGWRALGGPVEWTFVGGGLPLGPGGDGYVLLFAEAGGGPGRITAFVTAADRDGLTALAWLYDGAATEVRGRPGVRGVAGDDMVPFLAWAEDTATLVTLVGHGAGPDALAGVGGALAPAPGCDLATALAGGPTGDPSGLLDLAAPTPTTTAVEPAPVPGCASTGRGGGS